MFISLDGKKIFIGEILFWSHILAAVLWSVISQESFFKHGIWLGYNFVFIPLGYFIGFISFKSDIILDYEPQKESFWHYLFKNRPWWIWLVIIQIFQTTQSIAGVNSTYLSDEIYGLFKMRYFDHTKVSVICSSNIILCVIYIIAAPFRRLRRIEKMLLHNGKRDIDLNE